MKALLLLALLSLSSCGGSNSGSNENSPSPEPQPTIVAPGASGDLAGRAWTASSAIAYRTINGFEVIVAGPDEIVDCSSSPATRTHLSFETPTRTGSFVYNANDPINSKAPVVANLFRSNNGSMDPIFPESSKVEILGSSNGFVNGLLNFMEPSVGQISGSFNAKICSVLDQLSSLPSVWQGVGSVKREGGPIERQELEFSFRVFEIPGSDVRGLSLRLVNLQTERLILNNSDFSIGEEGIWQDCQGQRFRRGWIIPSNGNYSFFGLRADCTSSEERITFESRRSSLALSGSADNPFGKARFRVDLMRPKLNP
jgi:hypothetical protein